MKTIILALLTALLTVGCCTSAKKFTPEEQEEIRERRQVLQELRFH